jgi:hypothetical protein
MWKNGIGSWNIHQNQNETTRMLHDAIAIQNRSLLQCGHTSRGIQKWEGGYM